MPAYYRTALDAFVTENAASILWKLTQANAVERFPLTPQAIESWRAQLPVLTAGIAHLLRVFQMPQIGTSCLSIRSRLSASGLMLSC
jgi:hypothetical protein